MVSYKIFPENLPNEGVMFVNHQKDGRSGHMSHALVEYKKGHVMAFYSDCSGKRNGGHNGFGWIEYKRSADGARTWDAGRKLDYTWDAFLNEPFTVSCEKAVSPAENEVVVFCTRHTNANGWDPFIAPVALKSTDGGETWSQPIFITEHCGRIYDAICRNGMIYVLMLHGREYAICDESYFYGLYESRDGGMSFELVSRLPCTKMGSAYGAMETTERGELMVWIYNRRDEYHLDCFISADMGRTWTGGGISFCAKRIRNPQIARVRGGYILHGRSGCETKELPMQFVLYTSEDGIHWDEGIYVMEGNQGYGCYSNNLVLEEDGAQRVLIQASASYDKARVNVRHWMMEISEPPLCKGRCPVGAEGLRPLRLQ